MAVAKNKIKLFGLLAGVAILAAGAIALQPSTPQPQAASLISEPPAPQAQEPLPAPAAPVRLTIPKLGVSAAIDPMGLTPAGDMDAPTGPHNVGWFKFGSHPGASGTAVIAGHYGPWKNGEKSVFDNLHTLGKGDAIYVEDARGATTAFVVRESQTYAPDQQVPSVFGADDGQAHLNLITCQGTWNDAGQTYSTRLVVFADKRIE